MSEQKVKLSSEDKVMKRIQLDTWELQIRALGQNNELMERDLKEDMPNKRQRLKIRQNQVEIEKLKHDCKAYAKMLREGEETVDKVTKEDITAFNVEREKNKLVGGVK